MDNKQRPSTCVTLLEATHVVDESTISINDCDSNSMEHSLENSSPITPESKRTHIKSPGTDTEVTASDRATPRLELTATPPAQPSLSTTNTSPLSFAHNTPTMHSDIGSTKTLSEGGQNNGDKAAGRGVSIEWCVSISLHKTANKVKARDPCNSGKISKPVSKSRTTSCQRRWSAKQSPTGKTPSGGIVVSTSRGLFRF